MATVTLACSALHGLVMGDPAGLVPRVTINGPGRAWGVHGGHIPAGGAGVTEVDAGLWQRWKAQHPHLVPSVVYLVEAPVAAQEEVAANAEG